MVGTRYENLRWCNRYQVAFGIVSDLYGFIAEATSGVILQFSLGIHQVTKIRNKKSTIQMLLFIKSIVIETNLNKVTLKTFKKSLFFEFL